MSRFVFYLVLLLFHLSPGPIITASGQVQIIEFKELKKVVVGSVFQWRKERKYEMKSVQLPTQ